MLFSLPLWFLPILASAFGLGFNDLCKKHAVRANPVMPVLFLSTLAGSLFFAFGTVLTGDFAAMFDCSWYFLLLIWIKSLVVAASWVCVYYAMRELPISIVAPIRASSPLWTFLGSLVLFHEIPTAWQGVAMAVIFTGYYLFSIIGKQEGISFRRHKGIHMVFLGTLLGSSSALYDKYLLGVIGVPRVLMQFHFAVDLVVILGLAWLIRSLFQKEQSQYRFEWRWSIPATGILLILADWFYFYALSLPDTQISILSLMRRCSCVVTFAVGSFYFRDKNIKVKAAALGAILAGVVILALAK